MYSSIIKKKKKKRTKQIILKWILIANEDNSNIKSLSKY